MKKALLWTLTIVAVLGISGTFIWFLPPPQTRVVLVVSVGSDLHFGTTSHYIGLSTGEVVTVESIDWVIVQPGHCYRIAANTSHTEGIGEVPCPVALTGEK